MSMYVVGHKIPDSDSICGAIALAYLKNQIDEPAIPTRLGEVSPETQFISVVAGAGFEPTTFAG